MNEEIFLIMINPTDYDIPAYDLGFVIDEETAKKEVSRLSEEYKIVLKFSEELNTKRDKLSNELPQPEYEKYFQLPKWNSGLAKVSITQEMRDERTRLTDQQNKISERNYKKQIAFNNMILENMKDIYDSIPESCKRFFDHNYFLNEYLHEDQPYFYKKVSRYEAI